MNTNTKKETYLITVGTDDRYSDGTPIRRPIAKFERLERAIAYQMEHGGCIKQESDGKNLAPDGTWV